MSPQHWYFFILFFSFVHFPPFLFCGGVYVGAAATKLFAVYWGKWITGRTFSSTLFLKQTPPPTHPLVRGLRKKHAVISAAVAVVAKLNTLLALPPLINKTLECLRREGGCFPACITLSLNALWTLCLCFDTTNTHKHRHTHWFSPFGTFSLTVSRPIFTRKIFMLILKKCACNLPRVCTALQDTQHMYCAHAFTHKHKAGIENRGNSAWVPRFNVWIITSSLIGCSRYKGWIKLWRLLHFLTHGLKHDHS